MVTNAFFSPKKKKKMWTHKKELYLWSGTIYRASKRAVCVTKNMGKLKILEPIPTFTNFFKKIYYR